MKPFENKVVFITGASAGIGLALAREFSQKGASLVLTARRVDRLKALACELTQKGQKAIPVECDVTRDGDLERAVQTAIQELGRIDVVVANAGFGVVGDVEKLKLEDYRRQFETNVFGVLRTLYATLDELKKTHGTLVLLGSVAGYISLPGNSPYSMSKFAIHALAHSVTQELRPLGVSVVLIAPGFVESEIRHVDNQGKYHTTAGKGPASWLEMPTRKAAQKIVSAVRAKRAEQIITLHGKVAALIQRYCPAFISFWVRRSGLKGRSEP